MCEIPKAVFTAVKILGMLWLFLSPHLWADEKSVVLFDFEKEVDAWRGNPWGGGKVWAQKASTAKYGTGALCGNYQDVQKGASVVSPYLPEDAPWRAQSWGSISFWFKGDGSHGRVSLHLETSQTGSTGFVVQVPLEPREWTRFEFQATRFWSREKLKPDLSRLKRVYFGGSGTHSFEVDHICLHAVHREIPLDMEPVAICPRCTVAPTLDGKLDDECWKTATVLSNFVTNEYGQLAKDQTEVRLCWDAEHLYLGATMKMRDISKLKATLTRRDSPVYTDDCIEFFFDPDNAQKSWFQLATNPLGTLMDISGGRQMQWDADWSVNCAKDSTGWTAEVAIKFSSFGKTPSVGDVWGFNVGREIPGTGEISCWSCTYGKFHNLARWGHLVFTTKVTRVRIPYKFNEFEFGDYALVCDASALAQMGEVRLRLTSAQHEVFTNRVAVTPETARQREVFVPVKAAFKEQGEAKFCLTVLSGGDVVAVQTGRFIVFPPPRPKPKPFISIIPTPKKVVQGTGVWRLPNPLTVRCVGLQKEDSERCLAALAEECQAYYSTTVRVQESENSALWLLRANKPNSLVPVELAADFERLPEEGYILHVTRQRTLIAARDARGVFYGIQTLLQAIAQSTSIPAEAHVPAMSVVDFPSLRVRAASMSIPCNRWGYPNDTYVTPEFFCDFLRRTLMRWKYNMLVLIVGNGMKFDSHPECSGPAAWSKDEVRRVLDFCHRHYIEVAPLQTVLAHSNWFTLAHKDLWEDGDYHIACVSNPATQKLLREVYDEIIEVFRPKYMHLGMDEAWWKTMDTPPEKRCKLCAGKPKWEIVAEQATRFRDYLSAKGIRAMMWGDMLLEDHNGGPPYHSAKALEKIPRDIIICNWSTSLAPTSSKRFRDAGYEVIQSNSIGVNRQQAEWVIGNMMGVWMKNPWLTDSYFRGAQSFSFLSLLHAGELSWNVNEDVRLEIWRLDRSIIEAAADSALRQLALRPEPAASDRQRTIPLTALCNFSTVGSVPPQREQWFGLSISDDLRALPTTITAAGVTFHITPPTGPPNAIAIFDKPVVIPVNEHVASLYFLHGCHLDEKDREPFLKHFQKKDSMTGVLVGKYRIRYEDGSEDTMDMRYGWNVLQWKMRENVLPYCYAAPAVITCATDGMKARDPRGVDVQLYVAQWPNPHPKKAVVSVEFSSTGTEAIPFLLALSAKLPR